MYFLSFEKEINCSEVPQLINLIWIQPNDLSSSYIMVAYRNKCELICERTGDVLRQFQFGHLSTIRSMVELYDNERLEVLVTHSYASESIKLDFLGSQTQNANSLAAQVNQNETANTKATSSQKPNYSFRWNSEPNYVLCLFPYIIGFANQSIEIRLFVNGSLINSLTMSNVKLIASKVSFKI